jgi:hypothetical protein
MATETLSGRVPGWLIIAARGRIALGRAICCPICNNLDEHAAFGLVLRPTGIERGPYQRVGVVLGDDSFRLPQASTPAELDESRYQEFDESKGYPIELV